MGLFEEMEDFIFQYPFLPQGVSYRGPCPEGAGFSLFLGFELHCVAN